MRVNTERTAGGSASTMAVLMLAVFTVTTVWNDIKGVGWTKLH